MVEPWKSFLAEGLRQYERYERGEDLSDLELEHLPVLRLDGLTDLTADGPLWERGGEQ